MILMMKMFANELEARDNLIDAFSNQTIIVKVANLRVRLNLIKDGMAVPISELIKKYTGDEDAINVSRSCDPGILNACVFINESHLDDTVTDYDVLSDIIKFFAYNKWYSLKYAGILYMMNGKEYYHTNDISGEYFKNSDYVLKYFFGPACSYTKIATSIFNNVSHKMNGELFISKKEVLCLLYKAYPECKQYDLDILLNIMKKEVDSTCKTVEDGFVNVCDVVKDIGVLTIIR